MMLVGRFATAGFFSAAANVQMPSMRNMGWTAASAKSPTGNKFTALPPVPKAPYGFEQLVASGPLFPGIRIDGSNFGHAPAPVYVDGEVISETYPIRQPTTQPRWEWAG